MKPHLRENVRTFSNNFTTQESIRISRLKAKLRNLHNKKNFKAEIKPMTENLPDELYQLDSEHAKGAKLCINIMLELKVEKSCKTCFNVLERQYAKSNNF